MNHYDFFPPPRGRYAAKKKKKMINKGLSVGANKLGGKKRGRKRKIRPRLSVSRSPSPSSGPPTHAEDRDLSGPPSHSCEVCGLWFITSNHLQLHSAFVHDNLKSYKCLHCQESFGYVWLLCICSFGYVRLLICYAWVPLTTVGCLGRVGYHLSTRNSV